MKYVKILGPLAVAAAALMAFAGSASASTATSPAGTTFTGTYHTESVGHAVLHSENAPTPFTPECTHTIEGHIEVHRLVISGSVTETKIFNCTNGVTVVVGKPGKLSFTATGGGNAAVTSSEAEWTVHVPLGFKCIYTTNNTPVGELTGGTPAKLDFNSSTIPRTGGSAFCGTGAFLTGSDTVTTPSTLLVS